MTPVVIGGATLYCGDSLAVLPTIADNSIDSVVCDPPYELGFMGKGWDSTGIANSVEMWREALRVLKPGGHLLAFSGSRTYHRMTCAIEDAGFEVRDQIMWVYGSGFPKSMGVSKAIDKQRTEDGKPIRTICRAIRAGMDALGKKSKDLTHLFADCHPRLIDHWAARDSDSQPSLPTWDQWQVLRAMLSLSADMDAEVWRLNGRKGQPGDAYQNAEIIGYHEGQTPGFGEHRFEASDTSIRELSEAAIQWDGWGTALKPAHEPICVARKPLIGTVAANVLQHGTGAINIDGCRISAPEGVARISHEKTAAVSMFGGLDGGLADGFQMDGRWPANLIHDGSDEVLAEFPQSDSKGGGGKPKSGFWGNAGEGQDAKHGDAGSAARFFYCAKASRADRNEGLPSSSTPAVETDATMRECEIADWSTRNGNHHPTVKPTDLMAYLCRLVTPPGGTVLDPFCGSGSTGKAAIREGFKFIGIDMTAEYIAIATARISHEIERIANAAAEAQTAAELAARQPDLFAPEPMKQEQASFAEVL